MSKLKPASSSTHHFTHITTNILKQKSPKTKQQQHPCENADRCRENRAVRIECPPPEYEHCNNCNIRNDNMAPNKIIDTPGKGYCLAYNGTHPLPPHSHIGTYRGIMISQPQYNKIDRLRHPDTPFYTLDLGNKFYINAEHYGNNTRYINNSCNPNCRYETWSAQGLTEAVIIRQ